MTPQEIIKALENQGLTQYMIAKDAGVCERQINRWSKGQRPHTSNSHVEKLKNYYGLVMMVNKN